ncbi:MAG: ORF6N domain-containing protein [Alphaproteobacteria bacterium]|nr:ORF6N domain-containing protein [Alphaproteobacteria bacterium]
MTHLLIPLQRIEQKILLIRGQKVLLDSDLAELYGVTTKRLNEQVKRNIERFPKHFMFQLTHQELELLRSQFATTNYTKTRVPPYAFTEHGTLQAANVLNSGAAIRVGMMVIEAFLKLRALTASQSAIMRKLEQHEKQIGYLFDLLKDMATPENETGYKSSKIGYLRDDDKIKLRSKKS